MIARPTRRLRRVHHAHVIKTEQCAQPITNLRTRLLRVMDLNNHKATLTGMLQKLRHRRARNTHLRRHLRLA